MNNLQSKIDYLQRVNTSSLAPKLQDVIAEANTITSSFSIDMIEADEELVGMIESVYQKTKQAATPTKNRNLARVSAVRKASTSRSKMKSNRSTTAKKAASKRKMVAQVEMPKATVKPKKKVVKKTATPKGGVKKVKAVAPKKSVAPKKAVAKKKVVAKKTTRKVGDLTVKQEAALKRKNQKVNKLLKTSNKKLAILSELVKQDESKLKRINQLSDPKSASASGKAYSPVKRKKTANGKSPKSSETRIIKTQAQRLRNASSREKTGKVSLLRKIIG